MMLAADVHLGTKNCDFQMERYVFQRRTDGNFLIRFDPLDVVNAVSFPFMFNLFQPDLWVFDVSYISSVEIGRLSDIDVDNPLVNYSFVLHPGQQYRI